MSAISQDTQPSIGSTNRIFLDTNVYILGSDNRQSDEGQILQALGFYQKVSDAPEVIVSQELLDQISRVAKRLKNKDWSGELLGRIWQNLNVHYVLINEQAFIDLEKQSLIPREDIGVYLTAQAGDAELFISANHKLIRSLVKDTQEFACLTPAAFVKKYLRKN
ncbi:MAG: hypothetical protein AAFQ40_05930 [Cyanobacteria bacterium J06623_5]